MLTVPCFFPVIPCSARTGNWPVTFWIHGGNGRKKRPKFADVLFFLLSGKSRTRGFRMMRAVPNRIESLQCHPRESACDEIPARFGKFRAVRKKLPDIRFDFPAHRAQGIRYKPLWRHQKTACESPDRVRFAKVSLQNSLRAGNGAFAGSGLFHPLESGASHSAAPEIAYFGGRWACCSFRRGDIPMGDVESCSSANTWTGPRPSGWPSSSRPAATSRCTGQGRRQPVPNPFDSGITPSAIHPPRNRT
jgi:hypothetical protein